MKTIEINLYKFDELAETAKKKAVENLCNINVDHEWWLSSYEDAANIGLKISSFDLDRNRHCEGHFTNSTHFCANQIIKEHGENCETYKTAKEFLSEWDSLVEKYSDGVKKDFVAEENERDFDHDADCLEDEFLKLLLEDYSFLLQNEYDYLTSEAAIIETIEANDYDFTEDGELY
jgi:hypothetical protein